MTDVSVGVAQNNVTLLETEKTAAMLLLLHLLLGLLWVELVRSIWVLIVLPAGLLWLVTILLIIPSFGKARNEELGSRKARTLLAIPLTIILAILLSYVWFVPQRLAASLYLAIHGKEMARAEASSGARPAFGIHYLEGVPDGGLMIVRMRQGRPKQLDGKQIAELTGEGTMLCDRIIGGWLCGFD